MSTVEAIQSTMTQRTKQALIDLLYRLADDEIILGHRDSEWTGHGPILEEDIAFSSIAQDEMGHAQAYYQLLHELGEPEVDKSVFERVPGQYRCCQFVALPKGDWAFSVMRQFLYDSAESVRLAALSTSQYGPLADLAKKLQSEEKYHLMHGRSWILRLGCATSEVSAKLQSVLDTLFPFALGMFEPTEADESLAIAGIAPRERDIYRQWESAVAPVLRDAGLKMPANVEPRYGGRRGRHSPELESLLKDMQSVYRIDPTAKW